MWLGTKHIASTIPEQVAGVLMPDAQFRYGDVVYNVEVKCSTVAKAAEQVVRNVRKALEAGNRVLVALPDALGDPRLLQVLDGAFPGLRLWPDGVGVVWRSEDGEFHPHRVPGAEVWPFLEGEPSPLTEAMETEPEAADEEREADSFEPTDPLVRQLRWIVQDLVTTQKTEATIDEIRTRLPSAERDTASVQQIGRALAVLGVPSRRVKEQGARFRVYDLSRPTSREGPDGDPTLGPNTKPSKTGPDVI